MAERQFFGPSWINRDVDFESFGTNPAKTWTIVRKINEKNDQGYQEDWEYFDHTPMMALALFECANSADPSERAFIKIYIQIPYVESEGFSPEEKTAQAAPEEEMNEEMGLLTLTKLGCESAPRLINYKRNTQNDYGHVPGGFVVYLVTEKLPGIRLSQEEYWGFLKEKRQEIREAFKTAFEDCVGHGVVPVGGALGSSLLWDENEKKIYILNFELCCEATPEEAWRSDIWLTWGFAKFRSKVANTLHPLPPYVLEDGKINETIWEL